MRNLKVSIVIPIYNVEKYIRECLESVLKQTYKNIEIVLINDGSTDKSLEIIKKYVMRDNRIKIITKENGGLSSARNRGIQESTGDYIFNLDGDDFLDSDTIENLINEVFKSDDVIDAVIGDLCCYFDMNNKKKWKDSNLEINKIFTGKYYLENYFFVGQACYSACNKLWRKELYTSNQILHPLEISLGEDSNTVVRLMLKAKKVKKIDKIVYNYRINQDGMMASKNKKILEYNYSIDLIDKYFFENKEQDFFKKYKLSYKFFTLYLHALVVSNKEIRENKMADYLIVKEMFLKELKEINKDPLINKNITLKMKILLKLYLLNRNIADFLIILYKKIN